MPTNEGQARELAKVPEDERADVWQEAVEQTDGKPTAAAVKAARQRREQPPNPPAGEPPAEEADAAEPDVESEVLHGEVLDPADGTDEVAEPEPPAKPAMPTFSDTTDDAEFAEQAQLLAELEESRARMAATTVHPDHQEHVREVGTRVDIKLRIHRACDAVLTELRDLDPAVVAEHWRPDAGVDLTELLRAHDCLTRIRAAVEVHDLAGAAA